MRKKEKHTFSSTSMKSKSKKKMTTIFKSKWNTENVKRVLKVKNKYFFTYDVTIHHVLKSNNPTPVYGLWVLWFRFNLLSTNKYLFKDRDLLKISKSGSELALKEVASLHLKLILSKSQCTGTIKNIINKVIFE